MTRRVHAAWYFVPVLATIPFPITAQQAAEWHPALKARWEDHETWRTIAPGDLHLDRERLAGLRAVYERGENLVRDPLLEEAGFQFERGWLEGEPMLIARFYTSGDPNRDTSGPSSWTTVLDPTSMESLIMISTSTRFGSFLKQSSDAGTVSWRLRPDSMQWTEPDVAERREPMIELAVWGFVLSALPLAQDMEFQLQSMPTWIGPAFRVAGRTEFADTQGRQHPVWAVETNMGRAGWIGTTYVSDEAPFFFGFEMRHVETGDVNIRWRLKGFQWLDR